MSYTAVAKKFNRPNRPISRSGIQRHSRHVLTPSPSGSRPRGGTPMVIPPGQSAVEQAQALIEWHNRMAEEAKAAGQFIAAIAAKREVRAAIELQCKLSGELASAAVNFFAMEMTEARVKDFIEAAALRSPDVGLLIRDEALKRFGSVAPGIHVHFVEPPERNGEGTLKLLDANPTT